MNPYIIAIIDLGAFFIVPYLFLWNWKRAGLVWLGFLLTQITMPGCLEGSIISLGGIPFIVSNCKSVWTEFLLEITGLMLILIACLYNKDGSKAKHLNSSILFQSVYRRFNKYDKKIKKPKKSNQKRNKTKRTTKV